MKSKEPIANEFGTGDKLAFERTRLAYERTMMAWIRTAASLITFGFGTYKLFDVVPFVHGLKPGEHLISPRALAFGLAFLGNVALLLAAIQHWHSMRRMRAIGLEIPYSSAAVLGSGLAVIGIAVMVMVLLRI